MGMRPETNATERNKHDEIEVKKDRQRLKRWISKDYPLVSTHTNGLLGYRFFW